MAKKRPVKKGHPLSGMTGALTNLPWWVQGIAWVGAPVAGFGWVLYFILGSFNVQLSAMNSSLTAHIAASSATMDLIRKHLEDEVQQRWIQIGIEQRTCLNTSKTDADRIACAGLVRGQ